MNEAIGRNALDFMDNLLTDEETAESNLRVALIGELIKARQEKGSNSEKIRRIKRSKTACYRTNGKRAYKPSNRYCFKSFSPFG